MGSNCLRREPSMAFRHMAKPRFSNVGSHRILRQPKIFTSFRRVVPVWTARHSPATVPLL